MRPPSIPFFPESKGTFCRTKGVRSTLGPPVIQALSHIKSLSLAGLKKKFKTKIKGNESERKNQKIRGSATGTKDYCQKTTEHISRCQC